MEFNIAQFEDKATIEIIHASTHLPTGLFITVFGQDADVHRNFLMKLQNKRMRLLQRDRKYTPSAEELEDERLALIVACTESWTGLTDKEGNPVPCTAENAKVLYKQAPWIAEQVYEGMNDRANFLRN